MRLISWTLRSGSEQQCSLLGKLRHKIFKTILGNNMMVI